MSQRRRHNPFLLKLGKTAAFYKLSFVVLNAALYAQAINFTMSLKIISLMSWHYWQI